MGVFFQIRCNRVVWISVPDGTFVSADPLLTWAPKNINGILGVACNETSDWVALSTYGMKVRHFMCAVMLGTVATWITAITRESGIVFKQA